jgi:hypothetical protein
MDARRPALITVSGVFELDRYLARVGLRDGDRVVRVDSD